MISFKEFREGKNGKKEPNKTYFQVDGEFYVLERPKFLKIGLCSDLTDGKIWFVMKKGKIPTLNQDKEKA